MAMPLPFRPRPQKPADQTEVRLWESPCVGCPALGRCWKTCLMPDRLKAHARAHSKPATSKPAALLPFAQRPTDAG